MNSVLVTGGLGYIGSQLIKELAAPGSNQLNVRVIDNFQREGYHALSDLGYGVKIEFMEGDILDPAAMRRALDGVDAVIHLAALVRTPFSFDHPRWTTQVNHWGTARLVEHCLESGVRRLILASSASVFGIGGPFTESDAPKPVGPYSNSKLGAESHVLGAAERGLAPTVLRLGTVFGWAPAARFDALPNRLAFLAATGRALVINGTGEQFRPLIHVRDASASLRFALHHDETIGAVFNAVSENASVLDVVQAIRAVVPHATVRYTEQDALTYITTSVSSARLEALGWRPCWTLQDGAREIIERFDGVRTIPAVRLLGVDERHRV